MADKPWHVEVRYNENEKYPYFGYAIHKGGVAEIADKTKSVALAWKEAEELVNLLNTNDPFCEDVAGQPLTGELCKKSSKRDKQIATKEQATRMYKAAGVKGKHLKDALDSLFG